MNDTQLRLIEMLKAGTIQHVAFKALSITRRTHDQWVQEDEDYADAIEEIFRPNKDPTPEEIAAACREIQAGWSDARWAEYAPTPWMVAECRFGLVDLSALPLAKSDERERPKRRRGLGKRLR